MDKFDFDLYKKQTENIELSEEQKKSIISNILDDKKREKLTVVDFQSDYSKYNKYKNLIAVAAGFVIIISIAMLTNLLPDFPSKKNMDDFTLVSSLSDKKNTKVEQKDILVSIKDNKSGGNRQVTGKTLDLKLKGKYITTIDIYSEKGNYIVLNSYSSKTTPAEAKKSYKKIDYNDIDYLGWMPSYENVENLKFLTSQSTPDEVKYYMQDNICITIHFSNGDTLYKTLVVTYDENYNFIIN